MQGWTARGAPVELTPRQESLVCALLSRRPALLPVRGYGSGWSTALATAARYDRARGRGRPLRDDPGPDDPGLLAPESELRGMSDYLTASGAPENVREWYEFAMQPQVRRMLEFDAQAKELKRQGVDVASLPA